MSFLPTTITLSIQNLSLGLISFITAYTGHMLKVEFSLRLIPSVFRVSVNASFCLIRRPILLIKIFLYDDPSVMSRYN